MLRPGDIFCLTRDSAIQSGIIAGSGVLSIDNNAKYGHCGIVINDLGHTFEALNRYGQGNLYDYINIGCSVLVGRHVDMTPDRHRAGMAAVQHLNGKRYPFLRFLSWCLPYNLMKYIHPFNKPVCSELAFMYCSAAGLTNIDYYWGVSPDYVADAIEDWDVFNVVYEG